MKLSNKTRKRIAKCAEDARILIDQELQGFRLDPKNISMLEEVFELLVEIGILASKEAKHGQRGPKGSSKKTRRKGTDLFQ